MVSQKPYAVLVNGADIRLKEIIQSICNEPSSENLEMEVMPDHAHLLTGVDPRYGIHQLVKLIEQ